MLVKFCSSKREAWSSFLDTCVFAYNTSRHDSTRYTPFQLMFGRRATLPIDLDVRKESPTDALHKYLDADHSASFPELERERQQRIEEALANIQRAQKKQKEHYDRTRANVTHYRVGAFVLLKDFTRKKTQRR